MNNKSLNVCKWPEMYISNSPRFIWWHLETYYYLKSKHKLMFSWDNYRIAFILIKGLSEPHVEEFPRWKTLLLTFFCTFGNKGKKRWPSCLWNWLKGTQDWDFFWLHFWNLYYFFISYVKILSFYKKNFLIRPLLGEIRFFRLVWD